MRYLILFFLLCLPVFAAEPASKASVIKINKAEERIRLVRRNRDLLKKIDGLKKECSDLDGLLAAGKFASEEFRAKVVAERKNKGEELVASVNEFHGNIKKIFDTLPAQKVEK